MPNPMVRSLYKLADMEEDVSITLEPMDEKWHMRSHCGIVFHTQSKGEVTVQMDIISFVMSDIYHTAKITKMFNGCHLICEQ